MAAPTGSRTSQTRSDSISTIRAREIFYKSIVTKSSLFYQLFSRILSTKKSSLHNSRREIISGYNLNMFLHGNLFLSSNATIDFSLIIYENGPCTGFAADIIRVDEAQGNDIASGLDLVGGWRSRRLLPDIAPHTSPLE